MRYKETPFGRIPSHWDSGTILDNSEIVTDYVANGSFASLKENVQYLNTPDCAVLIRLVDFNNGFNGSFVYINEHSHNFLRKSKLMGGEIIISNVGANVGTVFKCPKLKFKMSLAPNSIMVKFKGVDDFYFHWLKSEAGQFMLKSIVSGSAQPKFNKTDFRKLIIPIPPIEEQHAIAATLSAFDDKIAVNNKINHVLEDMARAIFKSWFVDFEPWGGVQPSTWTCGKTEDFFDISIGKTPPRKEPQWFTTNSQDIIWVSISDMGSCGAFISGSSEYLTQESVERFNIKVVQSGTVLLSFKLTVGRVAIADGEMATNEAIAHFKYSDEITLEYLYCYLKAFDYQTLGSTSSIATAVNSKTIKAMPFIMPDAEDLKRFHNATKAIFKQIKANLKDNARLAVIRDSLLPKLMSGEIEI
jgi:type I restriction enzyme S subunit